MQAYRNREGVDLLTGAPNHRSLRIWMNNVIEPQTIAKRPALDFFQMDSSAMLGEIDLQEEWQQHLNSSTLLPNDGNNLPLDTFTRSASISVFDVKEAHRQEFQIRSNGVKSVTATGTGDVLALISDGTIGWVTSRKNAPRARPSTTPDGRSLFPEQGQQDQEKDIFLGSIQLACSPMLDGSGSDRWFFNLPRFRRLVPVGTVVCGDEHVCLVTDMASGRKLYAWGDNSQGQCGISIKQGPKFISSPSEVRGVFGSTVALGCGPAYTCCVCSNDTTTTLFSFGGGYASSRLGGMFKSRASDEGLVPHADVNGEDGPVIPLVQLHPGPVASENRPYNFWAKSLSDWVAQVDDEWTGSASIPLRRLDVPLEKESFDAVTVELENARNRLERMRSALDFDVSRCALFPPSDFFDDPAPFEIRKVLTNIEYEREANQAQLDMMQGKRGFNDDIQFLEHERKRILESEMVYSRLQRMWNDTDDLNTSVTSNQARRDSGGDREVLYSLLEDCRRCDLGLLARVEDFDSRKFHQQSDQAIELSGLVSSDDVIASKHADKWRSNEGPSLFTLLNKSDAILNQVKCGLEALGDAAADSSLWSLHGAVVKLHAKKKERNEKLRARLELVSDSLSVEVFRMRANLLNDSSTRAMVDLSGVTSAFAAIQFST